MTPPLAPLAQLLAEEPALRAVIARQPTVAVPDAARSLFVASLAGNCQSSVVLRPFAPAVKPCKVRKFRRYSGSLPPEARE